MYKRQRDRLRHGERIRAALTAAEGALNAGGEEGGVVSAWRGATHALQGIAELSPEYQARQARMENRG